MGKGVLLCTAPFLAFVLSRLLGLFAFVGLILVLRDLLKSLMGLLERDAPSIDAGDVVERKNLGLAR